MAIDLDALEESVKLTDLCERDIHEILALIRLARADVGYATRTRDNTVAECLAALAPFLPEEKP